MARRIDDDDDDEFEDDDSELDDDEFEDDDSDSDDDAEPSYATWGEWLEAYEDGYFDFDPVEEADGGVDYSGE